MPEVTLEDIKKKVQARSKERLADQDPISAPGPKSPETKDGPVEMGTKPEPDGFFAFKDLKPKRKKPKKKQVRSTEDKREPEPDNDEPVRDEPELEHDADDPDDEWMKGLTMDEVKKAAGQLEWAWEKFIPKSQISMFVGPQGVGKSYLMAYLIAVFTGAKQKWPDGRLYEGEIGPVILCETESMRSEYIARMERFNVDPKMVLFPALDDPDPIDEASYVVDITQDMEDVERLAKRSNASAIFIDSLSGGHSLDESKDQMRGVLQVLSGVAARTQLPVVVVHHPRKAANHEAQKITIDRVRGSSTITQFCRSVVGVYRLELTSMTSPVRVETVKSSFSGPGDPFGYTVTETGLHFQEAPEIEAVPTILDIASKFLLEMLQDGPMPSAELKRLAEEEGIKPDTLLRAKRQLGVLHKPDGKNTIWFLPTIDGTPYPVPK